MVSPAVVGPAPPTPPAPSVVLALALLLPPADVADEALVALVETVAVEAPTVVDDDVTDHDAVEAPVVMTAEVVVPATDAVSVVTTLLEVTVPSLPVLMVVALSLALSALSPFDSAGVEQPRSPTPHTSPTCERMRRSDTAPPVSYSFAGPAMAFACARRLHNLGAPSKSSCRNQPRDTGAPLGRTGMQ